MLACGDACWATDFEFSGFCVAPSRLGLAAFGPGGLSDAHHPNALWSAGRPEFHEKTVQSGLPASLPGSEAGQSWTNQPMCTHRLDSENCVRELAEPPPAVVECRHMSRGVDGARWTAGPPWPRHWTTTGRMERRRPLFHRLRRFHMLHALIAKHLTADDDPERIGTGTQLVLNSQLAKSSCVPVS